MSKTLQQIFEEQGAKFPFRVTHKDTSAGHWMEFHYRSSDYFYGHDSYQSAVSAPCVSPKFIPYTEPKKKVKLWPYLSWHYSNEKGAEVHWYTSKKEAKKHCGVLYIGPHPTLEPIDLELDDD